MALLDEQLVEEWLNRQGFFTMRGLKCGVDEIDLLAIRHTPDGMEGWHVEVQVSFRPIGYIGGNTSARRRNRDEVAGGVANWVEKKFTKLNKAARREAVLPGVDWRFVLVHARLRDPVELEVMKSLGVTSVRYADILDHLMSEGGRISSSAASNILEIIQYFHDRSVDGSGEGGASCAESYASGLVQRSPLATPSKNR